MDSSQIYSRSLKKMLGYKIIQDIQPEQIKIEKNKVLQLTYLQNGKSQDQLKCMKKKIAQNKYQRAKFEKQIEKIVEKMGEQKNIPVNQPKLSRKNHHKSYRIVTEPDERREKTIKFPSLTMNNKSYKNLTKRLKTQQMMENNNKQKQQIVNVSRLIRHYRDGMSSLRKLKINTNY